MAKQLTISDVEWKIEACQDDTPVRGNAMASGNEKADRRHENKILNHLQHGNVWAWASVCVTGTYKGILESHDYLGCCSYDDEKGFREGGYFEDMQTGILRDLQDKLDNLCNCENEVE